MSDLLKRGLKLTHLRLAAALQHETQLSGAADVLGIAQPAASRLAREIEAIIGAQFYTRAGRGIALTAAGRALAIRAVRVLNEIDDVGREVAELREGSRGRVSLGAVTGPAIEHVLPALRQARIVLPGIQMEVEVGPSDQLCDMLLDGRLDFALARLPPDDSARQFDYTPVGPEPLNLVVRQGHPLLRSGAPATPQNLTAYDWVMPPPGAILRETIETAFRKAEWHPPQRVLNTASFLLILATIGQTNAIAPIASSVADAFEGSTGVRSLPSTLTLAVEEYGILRRAGGRMTPAVQAVHDLLRDVLFAPQA